MTKNYLSEHEIRIGQSLADTLPTEAVNKKLHLTLIPVIDDFPDEAAVVLSVEEVIDGHVYYRELHRWENMIPSMAEVWEKVRELERTGIC